LLYPAANDLKTLLGSVKSHATDEDINKIISSLKGKSITQLISEGQGRLGGSGSAPAASTAPAKGAEKHDKKDAGKK
jgi:large subunit ribosomal protein LP2